MSELPKGIKVSKPIRRWILQIWKKEYEWRSIPKVWWKAMQRKGLTTDGQIEVANYLWKQLKNVVTADIDSQKLLDIYKRYKIVVKCLMRDSELLKHSQQLGRGTPYSTGLGVYPAKCWSYYIRKKPESKQEKINRLGFTPKFLNYTSETILLPIECKCPVDMPIEQTPITSDFARWQWEQFKHLSLDIKGAIESMIDLVDKPIYRIHQIRHLKAIYEGKHYCKTASTNRVFHLVSNLKSELRQFLLLNGKQCVDVDLKHSQPAFLGKLLLDLGVDEAEEYCAVLRLKNVRVYDYLRLKYDEKSDADIYKKSFLIWVYSDKTLADELPISKHIFKEWPKLAKAIEKLKDEHGYQWLSRQMQMIESQWVFNICQKLKHPCITIHDSFLVPFDKYEDTAKIINEAIEMTGIPTEIKVK